MLLRFSCAASSNTTVVKLENMWSTANGPISQTDQTFAS
jgi:hypothetical protein